ncbi:MAG: hypothetical protein IK116_06235 [Firmicutes bacterium]|nr:hypothetical protein [Bacillota bacterium]
MSRKKLAWLLAAAALLLCLGGCEWRPLEETAVPAVTEAGTEPEALPEASGAEAEAQPVSSSGGLLSSTADIGLYDTNGEGRRYVFTYAGEEFTARYRQDNWKIVDSYRVTEPDDMIIICQALIDVHPIPGRDGESWRTARDMAFEWLQHNIVYYYLPEDSPWKRNVRDVDFDPDDQGKSLTELYEDRTGREFDLEDLLG